MKLIWTPEAVEDRSAIWDYISLDNPAAAVRMDELFSEAAERLMLLPNIGRHGRIRGTRELIPHEYYRLVYEINDDIVWVLALVHTSRQWPPINV